MQRRFLYDYQVYDEAQDELWLSLNNGEIRRYSGTGQQLQDYTVTNMPLTQLDTDAQGNLWVASASDVWHLDKTSGVDQQHSISLSGGIIDLLATDDGFWLASGREIRYYDTQADPISRHDVPAAVLWVINGFSREFEILENQSLIISSTPIIQATVNQAYRYDVEATDADGDTLSFSLIQSPTGMSIDKQTGEITWLVDITGVTTIEIEVTDGLGNFDYQTYILTVLNRAPEITSEPITEGHVSSFYIYTVTANDPDDDALTTTLTTAPEGMAIDTTTGLIAWTEPVVGSYQISIQVDDENGGTDTQDYTLTITDEPVITSSPATLTFTYARYLYDVNASDPNNLVLSYQLNNPPAGMTIDSTTGEIDWTPTTAGDYTISITVENEQAAQTSQSFVLKVLGDNDLLIVSEPQTEAYVGEVYTYPVSVIGKDDDLNYALVNPPTGMTINEIGQVEWTPEASGDIQIQLTVSNNQGGSDTQSYTLNVKTLEEMDVMFNEIWNGMFQDLIDGDKESALFRLTDVAQAKYGRVFDALLGDMEEITGGLSPIQRTSITDDIAEYLVSSTIDTETSFYLIYFLRNDDGVWKLNSM